MRLFCKDLMYLVLPLMFFVTSCGGGTTGSDGSSTTTTYVPTRITASWSGGATGAPTDRRDTEATSFIGSLCPASSVTLTNHDNSGTFHIANGCTIPVTYAICLTEGVATQPENGLTGYCATDPFDTSYSLLTLLTLVTGTAGFDYNSTLDLSVNVFFCSDSQQITASPLADSVQCL